MLHFMTTDHQNKSFQHFQNIFKPDPYSMNREKKDNSAVLTNC